MILIFKLHLTTFKKKVMTIHEFLNNKRNQLKEAQKNIYNNRVFLFNETGKPFLNFNDFKEIIKINAEISEAKKGKKLIFKFDKYNEKLIEQLYFYAIKSEKFDGDIGKNILIAGKNGVGKTIIINSFLTIFEDMTNKKFIRTHSRNLFNEIKNNEQINYNRIPLYLEDLGKEEKIINDFGTQKQTIPALFSQRYRYNAWTFVCTNYNKNTLQEFYGVTIIDRFQEMFNFLKLNGESKRK